MAVVMLFMFGLIAFLNDQLKRVKTERNQAISFNIARQDSVKIIKQENGMLVGRIRVQDLTLRNAEQLMQDERLSWIRQFESVNHRLNNIEQASRTTVKIVGNFKIPLRDTVVHRGDSVFQVRTFDNHDKWFRVSGIIMPDTVEVIPHLDLQIRSVIVWERRKFLGLRIGKKDYHGESSTDNPYATISGMEITRIGKRK
jgi:hypothetical protein